MKALVVLRHPHVVMFFSSRGTRLFRCSRRFRCSTQLRAVFRSDCVGIAQAQQNRTLGRVKLSVAGATRASISIAQSGQGAHCLVMLLVHTQIEHAYPEQAWETQARVVVSPVAGLVEESRRTDRSLFGGSTRCVSDRSCRNACCHPGLRSTSGREEGTTC